MLFLIGPAPIGAPSEYAHSVLHVGDQAPQYIAIACGFYLILRAIPAIHEINALGEVL